MTTPFFLLLLNHPLDLEESAKPPHLENGLSNDEANDEQVPPLDSAVGALGGITVSALAKDNVGLLILDLGEELGKVTDYNGEVLEKPRNPTE